MSRCCFGLRFLSIVLLGILLDTANCQEFPVRNFELLGRFGFADQGDYGPANDCWGWTDPLTGDEYAIVGRQGATTFFNITDPSNPMLLGSLPSHTAGSTWRDIKVFDDHAFIVSDGNGPHGMQIFDLTQLRGHTSAQTWSNTAHYDGIRNSHNIVINEDTGYAYFAGSNRGGLYMVNINNPQNPAQSRSFPGPYVHDSQVVTYQGPDAEHVGREIAFNSSVSQMNIADVTNKNNPFFLSQNGYPQAAYAHQGWLSEDHRYFFMNDEADETAFNTNTRTHVWDVADLDNPNYVGFHEHETRATDHNLYVHDGLIYEANYSRGLRVLEVVDPDNAELREVAYLDTYPPSNSPGFVGAWSVYPYFDSGTIIVSDRQRGLFIGRMNVIDVDFDDNDAVDCADIDQLNSAIVSGSLDAQFDLNDDGQVDLADRDAWLFEAGHLNLGLDKGYLVGDTNLDGTVDGIDFIAWNDHKFTANSSWCSGDFNADGNIDGVDFILWNDNKFTSSGDAAVPEPCCSIWLVSAFALFAVRVSRQGSC